MSLLTDLLILFGAFSLGFIVGIVFMPLRRFVSGLWHTPGRLSRGARNVSAKLRQAFQSSALEEPLERTGFSGALAGVISDVLTLRVRHAEASFREGMAAFDSGDYELARRKFSRAIFWDSRLELKPLHIQAHLRLGWLEEEQGAWRSARDHYRQAVRLDAGNISAIVRLGMMHFRLGETGPAIFQFQRALELDPTDLDTHYHLYAIYRQAKMEREALEQLRIIKAGEDIDALFELFSRHGEENFRLSRYTEAVDDYGLAMQICPYRLPPYMALGDLYYLQQQPHTALEMWCRGLWVDYSDALAERLLAVIEEVTDPWPVIDLLRDCVARHSRDGRYHFLLARLLRYLGREEESIALLEKAVVLTPQLLQAQEELGDLYTRLGQDALASTRYRAGLSAARAEETVYRCQVCSYVTREGQARCFQCNHWGTLEKMTRAEAEAHVSMPRSILERANEARQSLYSLWNRIAGQLPPGT